MRARRASAATAGPRSRRWSRDCISMYSAPSRATSAPTANSAPRHRGYSSMRRAEPWLVLLLVVAVGVAVVAGRRRQTYTPQWEPASTYKNGPSGGHAPYEILARLGVPVERRRTALFDLAR